MEKIRSQDIIKSVKGIASFAIFGNGIIELNSRLISFENDWNKNRHILGIMATIDSRCRIADRLN